MSNVTDLPPEKLRDLWTGHVRRLLPKVPGCRHYVITAGTEAERALAANLAMWWKHEHRKTGEPFTDKLGVAYLSELLAVIPGALQDWRPGELPALPEIPKDPVTGQPMRNPHEEPKDLTSISQLAKDNPALNDHLKEIAKAGGSTYARIKRLREEAEARKVLEDFEYDYASNIFRTRTLTQQMEFAKRHPRPIVDVLKKEASTPVQIPWHPPRNMTRLMELQRRNPDLRALVDEGLALERQWAERDLEMARGTEAEIARTRASAEALLASK